MAKFHYVENFAAIQGEGRFSGVPSVFLRMFGCNFRCRAFGRSLDQVPNNETHNPEVVKIINNIGQYKTFKDLPLVTTGCDSYTSIYPEFKRFVQKDSADELAKKIVNLLPYKEWRDEHLVITGGEPLLGWQKAYPDLLDQPCMGNLKELTFETNGTQPLSDKFKDYLFEWGAASRGPDAITFSVSAKLSCSGEKREDAIKPEIVCDYQQVGYTYLKFVIATEQDANEALEVTEIYRAAGFVGPVYLMAEGGVEQTHSMNTRTVAELALKHGFRYSPRLQVDLFKNAWGT